MIDSNYLNFPGDLELIPSSLLYSSPLDSSPSSSLNHLTGFYDYLGNYDNQVNYPTSNSNNLIDCGYTDLTGNQVNSTIANPLDHYYYDNVYNYGDGDDEDDDESYNLTNLTNQLIETNPSQSLISSTIGDNLSPILSSSSIGQVNHRHSSSPASSISSSSSSSADYLSTLTINNQRPLSTTSIDSIDVNRSIDGCKRDLIKATLNFAIKSRRRLRGLDDIDLLKSHVKSSNDINHIERPPSWTDEDDEKKMSRRERNRIAARKCRKNRKLKYIKLNKTMENLDNINNNLREQLSKLERESGQLEDLLTCHQSQCYLVSWSTHQPTSSSSSSSLSLSSTSSLSSSPSPNHLLSTSTINTSNMINNNYSQLDESHGFNFLH